MKEYYAGSVLALAGEIGSGKTTLLRRVWENWKDRRKQWRSSSGMGLHSEPARETVPSYGFTEQQWERVAPFVLDLEDLRPGDLVVWDMPECHLHPETSILLMKRVYAALQEEPGAHVMIATHSLDLANGVEGRDFCVTGWVEGEPRVRCVTEDPDYEKYLGVYRTGEFWSVLGLDWIYKDPHILRVPTLEDRVRFHDR